MDKQVHGSIAEQNPGDNLLDHPRETTEIKIISGSYGGVPGSHGVPSRSGTAVKQSL